MTADHFTYTTMRRRRNEPIKAQRYPMPERDALYEKLATERTERDDEITLAAALGITDAQWGELKPEERATITEFFYSATAEILRLAKQNETVDLSTYHDWSHMLERLKAHEYGDMSDLPKFLTVSNRDRYLDTEVGFQELYPGMFLPMARGGYNYAKLLDRQEARTGLAFNIDMEYSDKPQWHTKPIGRHMRKVIRELQAGVPGTVEARMRDYEQHHALILARQVMRAYPDTPDADVQKIFDTYENLTDEQRPPHYLAFARRVFAHEYNSNPRLWVDEMLNVLEHQHFQPVAAGGIPDTQKT